MKQRKVTDGENIKWTCVQAYAGLDGKLSAETEEKSKDDNGTVTVVCTPSGGAQTVRLQLSNDWEDNLSDDELTKALNAGK